MATTVADLTENLNVTMYDFDPDTTNPVDVAWVDMRDSSSILMMFFRTVGTSAVTFKIIANSQSDGGGTDATIVTHAVGSEPDAVGDTLVLEVLAEQLAANSQADLRYVSASVSFATDSDEGVLVYIRKPKIAFAGLTADNVA